MPEEILLSIMRQKIIDESVKSIHAAFCHSSAGGGEGAYRMEANNVMLQSGWGGHVLIITSVARPSDIISYNIT